MKTIIITGASGGIGIEIAKKFAKQKNNLILIYNKNKDFPKSFKQTNCSLDFFQCDLSNTEQIKNTTSKILKKYKKVDCLINCAGISKFQQIQDTTEDDYHEVFNTNFKSAVMITSIISKQMISQKDGKIVNVSSIWGNVGASMESLYSASKAALNNFTLSLAKELGPSNINVNAVCPGFIDTKMNSHLTSAEVDEIVKSTPLEKVGKPEDVANLVEFLCDKKANFITGQIITIDGGLTL